MYEEIRSEIIRICRLSYEMGHVAAAHGNISARTPDDKGIIIKVSGKSFATITEDDLLFVDWDGGVYDCDTLAPSDKPPSMELQFHSWIYPIDDEICAVVHLHSPYATALSMIYSSGPTNGEIPLVAMEARSSLKKVPIIPLYPAGSQLLAEAVQEAFVEVGIMAAVLCEHGPVGIGRTLEEAYNHVDNLEHNCKVATFARLFRQSGNAGY